MVAGRRLIRIKERKMQVKKLLIVDDEIDIREFSKSFFQKRGIDVYTADEGTKALNIIEEQSPDLVLLDVQLGVMTGVEVLENLRANNNDVKVIMVTGNEDEDIVNSAKKLGVRDYIHKPLILEELEKIVLAELEV